jgi:anti-sigma factor ChrR (cupin superfamily)
MADDPYRDRTGAYALGVLDPEERAGVEAHLSSGCEECAAEVASFRMVLSEVPRELPATAPPDSELRRKILDLAEAPPLPWDLQAYTWDEIEPGVRVHVFKEDPARGLRACLIWAAPGARHPHHRHLGEENILVLQGALADEHGVYGPGQICRSRRGSIHSERALPGDDCLCYVVYYGDLEPVDSSTL